MTERKLIIFDFDGTLVDSQGIFDAALMAFSRLRGLPYDTEKMKQGYINPLRHDLGWGVPLERQPELFRAFNVFMEEKLARHDERYIPRLFDHVQQVLEDLSGDYDMGIITARNRGSFLAILKYHGLTDLFPHYRSHCCAQDRGYPIKPAADAVHCLLNDSRHSIDRVVVIGDTTADIGMANAAGTKSIGVLWGAHDAKTLQDEKPSLIIEDMLELPGAVRGVFLK